MNVMALESEQWSMNVMALESEQWSMNVMALEMYYTYHHCSPAYMLSIVDVLSLLDNQVDNHLDNQLDMYDLTSTTLNVDYRIDIPKDMWEKSKGIQGPMLAPLLVNHMKLVHYQLLRLRAGLLLATLTGRVLVMPPIWCEIDKYWAPLHDGEID
jgi:hypothetical protein